MTNEDFLCKICHKGFKTNSTLKQHIIVVHYSSHHCDKCPYKTKTKYLLVEHKRKKHGTPGNYSLETLQLVQEAELRSQQESTKEDMELAPQLIVQMDKTEEPGTPEESFEDNTQIEDTKLELKQYDTKLDLEENVSKKRHCGECAGCTRDPCGNCPSCLDLAKVTW